MQQAEAAMQQVQLRLYRMQAAGYAGGSSGGAGMMQQQAERRGSSCCHWAAANA